MSEEAGATVVARAVTHCVRPGLLGYAADYILTLPGALWYTRIGLAFLDRDVYLLWFSASYYIEVAWSYVLLRYFQSPRPNPDCNMGEYGMPSAETQLSFLFIGFAIGHYLLWREAIEEFSIATVLLLGGLVPAALYLNGLNTFQQIFVGAAMGLFSGVARVYIYKYYLLPYMTGFVELFPVLERLELRNAYFQKLLEQKQPQHPL